LASTSTVKFVKAGWKDLVTGLSSVVDTDWLDGFGGSTLDDYFDGSIFIDFSWKCDIGRLQKAV